MGIPSQKRHITRVFAVIWGIILIIVVAGRWSQGGGLRNHWTIRVVDGIWGVGRERWRRRGSNCDRRCYNVPLSCLFRFNSGRLTYTGARKTTWGALAAPRKGHEQESTRSDVVAEDGGRKGPVCERYGAGTTEVHSLHSEVVVEGEESCGVRKDSVLCTVRHRGSALDRSAAMISDEQTEGPVTRDLHSRLEDSETSR